MSLPALAYDVSQSVAKLMTPRVEPVTEQNWTLLAMHVYDNPACGTPEEFFADMKHFKYIRKLLTQYYRTGELKERLILNHIIMLGNVLGPEVLVRVLFLKMNDYLPALTPFLILLNILPDVVQSIGPDAYDYRTDEIKLDTRVISAIRESIHA